MGFCTKGAVLAVSQRTFGVLQHSDGPLLKLLLLTEMHGTFGSLTCKVTCPQRKTNRQRAHLAH